MTAPDPRWNRLDWYMPGLSERVLKAFGDLLDDAGHDFEDAGAEVLVVNPSDTFTYRMHDGSLLVVAYDYDGAPDAGQDLIIHSWAWSWAAP